MPPTVGSGVVVLSVLFPTTLDSQFWVPFSLGVQITVVFVQLVVLSLFTVQKDQRVATVQLLEVPFSVRLQVVTRVEQLALPKWSYWQVISVSKQAVVLSVLLTQTLICVLFVQLLPPSVWFSHWNVVSVQAPRLSQALTTVLFVQLTVPSVLFWQTSVVFVQAPLLSVLLLQTLVKFVQLSMLAVASELLKHKRELTKQVVEPSTLVEQLLTGPPEDELVAFVELSGFVPLTSPTTLLDCVQLRTPSVPLTQVVCVKVPVQLLEPSARRTTQAVRRFAQLLLPSVPLLQFVWLMLQVFEPLLLLTQKFSTVAFVQLTEASRWVRQVSVVFAHSAAPAMLILQTLVMFVQLVEPSSRVVQLLDELVQTLVPSVLLTQVTLPAVLFVPGVVVSLLVEVPTGMIKVSVLLVQFGVPSAL